MNRPLALITALALLVPAAALAETVNFTDDNFGDHGQIFIDVKTKNGHFTKITTFGWSGLPCQFPEGAFGKAIKVKNNHFADKNSPDGQTTYKVKGDFVKDGTKIKGTISAAGNCDTGGKQRFAARANVEG